MRFAIVALVFSGAVSFSLGYTYASGIQAADSQQQSAQASVTALKQINSDPFTNPTSNHKTQVEPGSFSFGDTIVTALQSGRFFDGGASDIAFSTSTDAGKTWIAGSIPSATQSSSPPNPTYQRASDPTVAYDLKHNVWLISFLGLRTTSNVDVLVSRSTDGGRSFGAPIILRAGGSDLLDKNWTTCDDTPSSPFFGQCYTEFDDNTQLNLVQLSTSTDGGATWGPPVTTPDQACVIGGQPLVQPNGTLVMPIDQCTEDLVMSVRSTDGGKTLSLPTFIGQALNFGAQGNLRAPDLPSATMDGSGTVYVTWQACQFNFRCTRGVDDLLLSSSKDGLIWTVPTRIPIASPGSTLEPMLPGLGADIHTSGTNAHLGLVYYFYPNQVIVSGNTARFCTTNECQLEVGFISSTNGGQTWSAPQTLAGPMSLHWLPLTTQGFMVGDYFATSFVSGEQGESAVAFPIFMVASAPTIGATCSTETKPNLGAPGQNCNEPTFTVANGIQPTGGNQAATPASATSPQSGSPVQLAIPEGKHSLQGSETAN